MKVQVRGEPDIMVQVSSPIVWKTKDFPVVMSATADD
jgi:hypothetical protein